ncbi:nuclease HARBI1-like protein [Perilla frutescens var. hirtella]|nr:nuclease HARBI1-like protein [Perilla frutescens var. hirtella]
MKSDLQTRDFDGFGKSGERCDPAAGGYTKLGLPAVARPNGRWDITALNPAAAEVPSSANPAAIGSSDRWAWHNPLINIRSRIIMGDSQQDSKKRTSYEPWSKEETDLLLELMVDGARRGWRDNSGIFSKATVEERILTVFNERLGSGFGYDDNTKKFTATDEVWDVYLSNDAFVALSKDEQLPSSFTPPSGQPEVTKSSTQRPKQVKRSRTQYEATSGSSEKIMEEVKTLFGEVHAKTVLTLLGEIDIMRQHIERSLQRQPITRIRYHFVKDMIEGDPQSFRQLYRMYPDAFLKLCSIIRDKTPLQDTRHICVEEMVATFLIIVGHNDRYYNVRQRFSRSHFATSQNFNKVLKALNMIAPDMMVKPSIQTPTKIQDCTRFMPFFKNVLAACNFDLQFMYVLSGWEGSAHDSKLLSDALSRTNGLHVPQGKYFLVDCGFANRRQFLAPLRGVRYHLKDFGGQGRHPRNASELFNLRHASLRNVIERIFGVFKSRFTIFKTTPPFSFQIQAELVLACTGLHNFLRKECPSDEFPVEYEGDEDLPPPPLEEENMEWLSQSQLQQRTEANAWRMSIANAMWEARPTYNGDGNDDETEDENAE